MITGGPDGALLTTRPLAAASSSPIHRAGRALWTKYDRPVDGWSTLANPWRACLELSWEAYRVGTVPVGAVVVDPHDTIVLRGRNRVFEARDPGSLAGTRLAHAEVDALARLSTTALYLDHVLYSALEPCLLCLGAALMSTVGRIRYAGADPAGGACRVGIPVDDLMRRELPIDEPLGGWAGQVAQALSVAFWLGLDDPRYRWIAEAHTDETVAAAERIRALAEQPDAFEDALPALLGCLD
jgi:tRNA(Arg) A34 adenosine deaminase TadA